MLQKFIVFAETVNEKVGRAFTYMIYVFMLLMVYEVISRYFFKSPTSWVHELCGFLFAGYVAMTGGWVLKDKGHVAVDIIYQHFPPRGKRVADLIVTVASFLMFAILLKYGWKFAWHALKTNQHSHTVFGPPLWPVKMLLPAGSLLFLLQILADFAKTFTEPEERSDR